jgi:hypothetical protein
MMKPYLNIDPGKSEPESGPTTANDELDDGDPRIQPQPVPAEKDAIDKTIDANPRGKRNSKPDP